VSFIINGELDRIEQEINNQEIGLRLALSHKTIARHRERIMKKLNRLSRTELKRESFGPSKLNKRPGAAINAGQADESRIYWIYNRIPMFRRSSASNSAQNRPTQAMAVIIITPTAANMIMGTSFLQASYISIIINAVPAFSFHVLTKLQLSSGSIAFAYAGREFLEEDSQPTLPFFR
jgi:hypothetical protein